LKNVWRSFKGYFLRPPELALQRASKEAEKFNPIRFYLHDIPLLLKQQSLPFGIVALVTVAGVAAGLMLARQYPVPPEAFPLENVSEGTFEAVQQFRLIPQITTSFIFLNNVRVIVLALLVGFFSFGSLTLLVTLMNVSLVSFIIAQIIMLGYNPWLFMSAFILPHGIIEIPAVLLGMTFALRIGAAMVSPPAGLDIGQGVLLTTANFFKILIFLLIPLLLLAAYIEANITPQIVLAVYAGQ
jgi:uncharacterized membrane protein SpoIIM required for sporulation